jgi:arylsulfatase A-like enzyme
VENGIGTAMFPGMSGSNSMKGPMMRRRDFLSATTAGAFSCLAKANDAAARQQPNLLFIMTDQQTFRALGAVGNPEIKTPNMDRLAREGALFSNAYCTCPVCGPSRTSIVTGSSAHTTRVYENSDVDVASRHTQRAVLPTYDEILSAAGYTCEYWGKTHFPDQMFKAYADGTINHHVAYNNYLNSLGGKYDSKPKAEEREFKQNLKYIPNPFDPTFTKNGKKGKETGVCGKLVIDNQDTQPAFLFGKAIDAVKRLSSKPFAISCSVPPPHAPFYAPDPWYSMYDAAKVSVPENYCDEQTNSPYPVYRKLVERKETIPYFIATYYAMVSEVDHYVGRILDALDATGKADNTLVIFTSDHGEMLGAHGMFGKFNFFDESSKIPLLMRFPKKIAANQKIATPVSLFDLFPTILELLDSQDRPVRHGHSLVPLLTGMQEQERPVFSEWFKKNCPNYMCRLGNWKLMITWSGDETLVDALYNLKNDPFEMNNCIGNNPDKGKYLAKAEELRALVVGWCEQTGADEKIIAGLKARVL